MRGGGEISKHTEGPWFYDDGDGSCYGIFTKPDGQAVAYLANIPSPEGPLRSWEEDLANARLMAAAPNLLDACVEAEDLFALEGSDGIGNTCGAACIRQLRVAIAKARGEELAP